MAAFTKRHLLAAAAGCGGSIVLPLRRATARTRMHRMDSMDGLDGLDGLAGFLEGMTSDALSHQSFCVLRGGREAVSAVEARALHAQMARAASSPVFHSSSNRTIHPFIHGSIDFQIDYDQRISFDHVRECMDAGTVGKLHALNATFVRWCDAVAAADGVDVAGCHATTHVRALTGATRNERTEMWHVDGSYLTVVYDVLGAGTQIAPSKRGLAGVDLHADLPPNDETVTIPDGGVVMLSGERRPAAQTVHRAPRIESSRLVMLVFYYDGSTSQPGGVQPLKAV